jgi:hypothetical protein
MPGKSIQCVAVDPIRKTEALSGLPDETFDLLARLQGFDDLDVMNFKPTSSNAPALIGSNQFIVKDATIEQMPGRADIRLAYVRREKIRSRLGRITIDLHEGKAKHMLPLVEAAAHETTLLLVSAHDLGKPLVRAFLREMNASLGVIENGVQREDIRPIF